MDATSGNDESETANNAKQSANETSAFKTTNDSQEMQCHAYEFRHQHSSTEFKKQDQLSSYQTLLASSISLNQPDDVIENGEMYLELAEELGDQEAEKTALLSIGQACLSTNRYKDAILHCEECHQIASSTGDNHVEMRACLMLSKAYAAIHHYNLAISRGNKCIDIAKEAGDIEVEMNAYLEIGNLYRLLDQHYDAEMYCSKSLEMAKEASDKLVEQRAYLVLALASPSISQIVNTSQHIRKSNNNAGLHLEQETNDEQQFNSNYQYDLEKHSESLLVELISRSLNLPYLDDTASELAITPFSLAHKHHEFGMYEEAIKHAEKAIKIAEENSDKNTEMDARLLISDSYWKLEQFDNVIMSGKRLLELANELDGNEQPQKAACWLLVLAYDEKSQYIESLSYSQKCLELATQSEDKILETKALYSMGKSQYFLYQYDDAIKYCMESLQKAKEISYSELAMESCIVLSNAYSYLENYSDSYTFAVESLEIAKDIGDKEKEMDAYFSIALASVELGNYDEAIKHTVKVIDITQEISDKQTEMNACELITDSYQKLEQYDNVVVYGKRWLLLANDLNDDKSQKTASWLLAIVYSAKSQYSESLSYSEKCLELAIQSDDRSLATKALNSMGDSQYHLHQYDDAVKCCMESLQKANETGDSEMAMESCIVLSKAYIPLEQYSDSYTFALKGFEIAKNIGDKKSEIKACFVVGKVLAVLGNYPESIKYLMIVIHYYETVADKDMNLEASAYEQLIKCFKNLHQYEKVLYYTTLRTNLRKYQDHDDINKKAMFELYWFHAFVNIRDNVGDMNALKENTITNIVSLLYISLFHELNEQYEMAIESLNKIFMIELGSLQEIKNVSAHWEIARIYTLQDNIDKAIEHCQVALSYAYARQCTCDFFSHLCCERLGTLYLKQNQNKKAVLFLQIAIQQGDAVQDQLYHYNRAITNSDSGWDNLKILIHEKQILCYKLVAKTLIESGNHQDALMQLEQSRGRVLMEKLMDKYGMKRDSATMNRSLQQYEDIESLLSTDRYTLIVYFVFIDNLHTFLIQDKKDLQFIQQSINDCEQYFQSLIERCYREMRLHEARGVKCENRSLDSLLDKDTSQDQDDDYFKSLQFPEIKRSGFESRGQSSEGNSGNNVSSRALEELYNTLFEGLQIDQDEIVIIPDGHLYKVPFAALRNPQTGRYLIESKRVRFITSMANLKLLEEKANNQQFKGALIVGNPKVDKVMFNGRETEQIKELPNAELEAHAVKNVLIAPRDQCLTRADATKAAVLDRLKQGVSVIHIAAHGFLEKSTIALAPSPEVREKRIPVERDYMLTMADVQDCHIDAQLVVLSCCHSGRGEIMAEGVIGMCRAFLASGARAVVASLWAIDDDFTSYFMYTFYGYLKNGYSASESLQMAMKDSIKNEMYRDPKYWAPFFLMGDDVKIQF